MVAIAAGLDYSCTLTGAGGVRCWGSNQFGQLGDGTTDDRSAPVDAIGLSSGVTGIAAGGIYACALAGAAVKCWGAHGYGSTPVAVPGVSGVTAIAAGGVHSCALMSGGTVKCWGRNDHGELGDGTTSERSRPVDVSGLNGGVTAIATGSEHSCALTRAGGVKCWGRNDHGELGDGTTSDRPTPVNVSGLNGGVSAIAAGAFHSCAVTRSGGVK